MCYIVVEDVDQIYESFTSSLKEKTGKISRSGIPRISKLKDLAEDRRFILTDVGGNTFFVGTPNTKLSFDNVFFRTIDSSEHANHFEVLYDLMYSKEDSHSASLMWTKFFPDDTSKLQVSDLDLAKILLVALDIGLHEQQAVNQEMDDKLTVLLQQYGQEELDWTRIAQKYNDIMNVE
jgi:hypothetical protein